MQGEPDKAVNKAVRVKPKMHGGPQEAGDARSMEHCQGKW